MNYWKGEGTYGDCFRARYILSNFGFCAIYDPVADCYSHPKLVMMKHFDVRAGLNFIFSSIENEIPS